MTEDELRRRFGKRAVDALLELLRAGETPEVDPELFGTKLADAGIEIEVISLLDAAAEAALVERVSTWRCPEPSCRRIIDTDAITNRQCPYCKSDFRETGDNPAETFVYRISTAVSRSVPWLIGIHGFNTRGPWQEEFS